MHAVDSLPEECCTRATAALSFCSEEVRTRHVCISDSADSQATREPVGGIIKQGWLWKEGHKLRTLKKRFFRLVNTGMLL